jgi:hypothetical protein
MSLRAHAGLIPALQAAYPGKDKDGLFKRYDGSKTKTVDIIAPFKSIQVIVY